ncbi:hypothetical protein I11999_12830 [Campylobacter coli]|nr:hypothetical protein I11999_12830 [Campylobacter coli]
MIFVFFVVFVSIVISFFVFLNKKGIEIYIAQEGNKKIYSQLIGRVKLKAKD